MFDYLTSVEAAKKLHVSDTRIRQFIVAGRLPAVRRGRMWFIRLADLRPLMGERKPGWKKGKKRGKRKRR